MTKTFKKLLNFNFRFYNPAGKLIFVLCLLMATSALSTVASQMAAAQTGKQTAEHDSKFPYTDEEFKAFSDQAPLVLENFTAKDCAFCPKADRLLAEIAERTDIIALSCHVDYYDIAQNPLSQPVCSERQFNYAASIDGSGVQTPQIIVNGRAAVTGYNSKELLAAVSDNLEYSVTPLELIQMNTADMDRYSVKASLPDLDKTSGPFKIFLIEYIHVKKLGSRTDAGAFRRFTNLVTSIQTKDLDPSDKTIQWQIANKEYGQGLAVLIQKKNGQVVAAGKLDWPDHSKLN